MKSQRVRHNLATEQQILQKVYPQTANRKSKAIFIIA